MIMGGLFSTSSPQIPLPRAPVPTRHGKAARRGKETILTGTASDFGDINQPGRELDRAVELAEGNTTARGAEPSPRVPTRQGKAEVRRNATILTGRDGGEFNEPGRKPDRARENTVEKPKARDAKPLPVAAKQIDDQMMLKPSPKLEEWQKEMLDNINKEILEKRKKLQEKGRKFNGESDPKKREEIEKEALKLYQDIQRLIEKFRLVPYLKRT
jgi:hypothetical protein